MTNQRFLSVMAILFFTLSASAFSQESTGFDTNPVYRSKIYLSLNARQNLPILLGMFKTSYFTPGFTLGGEYSFNGPQFAAIGKHFAIGGVFAANGYYFSASASNANGTVRSSRTEAGITTKLSVYGKFQQAIEVPHGHLGVYVMLPIALPYSLSLNMGLLCGLNYFFEDHWGLFFDVGGGYSVAARGRAQVLAGESNLGVTYAF